MQNVEEIISGSENSSVQLDSLIYEACKNN